jgi:hypothetical protein
MQKKTHTLEAAVLRGMCCAAKDPFSEGTAVNTGSGLNAGTAQQVEVEGQDRERYFQAQRQDFQFFQSICLVSTAVSIRIKIPVRVIKGEEREVESNVCRRLKKVHIKIDELDAVCFIPSMTRWLSWAALMARI